MSWASVPVMYPERKWIVVEVVCAKCREGYEAGHICGSAHGPESPQQ